MKLEYFNFFQNRYRLYLVAHLVITALVILFFKVIPEVKIAAFCAGILFLTGPTWVLIFEFRARKIFRSLSTYGALGFLLTSALPVFLLRITNWNEPFDTLHLPEMLGGFTGPELHKASTDIFYMMLATFFFDSLLSAKRQREKSDAL